MTFYTEYSVSFFTVQSQYCAHLYTVSSRATAETGSALQNILNVTAIPIPAEMAANNFFVLFKLIELTASNEITVTVRIPFERRTQSPSGGRVKSK